MVQEERLHWQYGNSENHPSQACDLDSASGTTHDFTDDKVFRDINMN